MWRLMIYSGTRCFWSGIFSLGLLRQLFTFGAFQRWTCWHLLVPLNTSIITPWNLNYPWGLGVECLQPSLDISGMLCVSFSYISSSGSVQVSGGTCQRSTQMVESDGTVLDGSFLDPHRSQHVARHSLICPIIKDLVMDVLVGQALKGLSYLHLNLCLLSNVCYADKGSLPQSVRQWWGQLKHLCQRSTSSVGRNGSVGVLDREYQKCNLCY